MEDRRRADDRRAEVVPQTLSDEAKEPFDETLSKATASRRIDDLQKKTGRGRD